MAARFNAAAPAEASLGLRRAAVLGLLVGGWRLARRPGLDGVRGLAILLVLICHGWGSYGPAHSSVGAAGVELFFVLSGFLITALLVEEQAAPGGIRLRRFYERRARRLLPALVLIVGTAVALGAMPVRQVPPILFYYENWVQLYGRPEFNMLGQTWSLAVEEQFYLVWPVLLLVALRWRRGPLVVAGGGALASLALRLFLHDPHRVYAGTDTQAWALLSGATLAILAHQGLPEFRFPRWVTPTLVGGLLALAPITSDRLSCLVVSPAVVPVAVVLIWAACSERTLAWKPLQYLGRRSYAIYLWHLPLLIAAYAALGHRPLAPLVGITAALAVSELSWRYVERPFMRMRLPAAGVRDPAPA